MGVEGACEGLTLRALLVGLSIGTMLCMTNMYFGLQAGWITMGSVQSAILGFGAFKIMQLMGFGHGFSIAENVIVQTTSVATATMPLAAGFVGVIPAMEMLSVSQNPPDGKYVFTTGQLILWSLMLALFGIFVAVPLRTQVIEREKLRFPSGTATANVIRVLHSAEQSTARASMTLRAHSLAAGDAPRHKTAPAMWPAPSLQAPAVRPHPPPQPVSEAGAAVGGGADAGVEMASWSGGLEVADDGWLDGSVRPSWHRRAPATLVARRPSAPDLPMLPELYATSSGEVPPPPATPSLHSARSRAPSLVLDEADDLGGLDLATIRTTWFALGASFAVSFFTTTFVAVLDAFRLPTTIPFLGPAAAKWGWQLAPYMGYVGQGMIMGSRVTLSMLAGAVFAFGILGPYAVHKGWAPGHLEKALVGAEVEEGSKAWLTWVSLSIMIADSLTSLAIVATKFALAAARRRRHDSLRYTAFSDALPEVAPPARAAPHQPPAGSPAGLERVSEDAPGADGELLGRTVLRSTFDSTPGPLGTPGGAPPPDAYMRNHFRRGAIPVSLWSTGLVVSSVAAVAVLSPMFSMPATELGASVLMAMLVAVLAVRALGETDLNPVSGIGKLSQIFFAIFFPHRILPNLVAGALAEASAQQAGDMMQDFKCAWLLGVCPRMQFYAMAIGSCASCVVSTGAYLLYRSVYEIGGSKLPAPAAKVWLSMADLVNGGSLPDGVILFCYLGGLFGLVLALIPEAVELASRALPSHHRLKRFLLALQPCLPSGIGFAIGMYITPDFTLPRVIGTIIEVSWLHINPKNYKAAMIVAATGLVLGDGISSMVTTLSKALVDNV